MLPVMCFLLAFLPVSGMPAPFYVTAAASGLEVPGETPRLSEGAPPSPDLTVMSITSIPEYPSAGDRVTFNVMVKNQGDGPAGPFRIKVYLDDALLGQVSVSSLAAGYTMTEPFTWTAEIGTFEVKAVADANNELAESNENNNTKVFSFSPLAPDLIVQAINLDPLEPSKDDSVKINVVVKNRGSSSARFNSVMLYIDGASRGELDVPALDAGATVTKIFTWTAQPGAHQIRAVADNEGFVKESDETNNENMLNFATLDPDLIVETISWTPEKPSKGDNVTFTVGVKNQGEGRADYSYVDFYIDGESIGSKSVNPLGSGADYDVTFTWKAQAGSHSVKAMADSNSWLVESDETNNEKIITFAPLAPDLVIKSLTWSPLTPSVGDSVTFTVAVENRGSGRAEATHVVYYIQGGTSGYLAVSEIEAGATVSRTFAWRAEAGIRIVRVVADSSENVAESNESNNDKSVEFVPIAPDMIIQNVTWSPEAPLAGDTVEFIVTVKNASSGRASGSHAALYIDGEFLSSVYVNAQESGASANVTFPWTVVAGLHQIKAVADSSFQLAENDETNNEKSFSFAPAAPDLIVQDIRLSPETFSPGEQVTVTIIIKNDGTGRAEYSHVSYFIDGVDRGYHDIQGINAGATVTRTFAWTAEGGVHSIRVIADANNHLAELVEINNVKTRNLPPADLLITDVSWTPENPQSGDEVTFMATVQNRGSGRAGPSKIAFYVDDVLGGYIDVPALDAAANEIRTFTWTSSATAPEIRIIADAIDEISEGDESNNEKSFTLEPSVPDLVVSSIDWKLANPGDRNEVTFIIGIENRGSGRSGGFQIDCASDGVYVSSAIFDPIEPGGIATKTFTWKADTGSHTLRVVADMNNAVVESNENNNEKSVEFSTIVPDLTIDKLTVVPEKPLVGDMVTFTVTLQNKGSGKSSASRFAYYIGGILKGYSEIPVINAGASTMKSVTWIAEEGNYDFRVVVDLGQEIAEIDETNNEAGQELVVSSVKAVINPTGNSASGDSKSGGLGLTLWWGLVAGGILLSVTLCIIWIKAQ